MTGDVWAARADLAQDSLDVLHGAPWPQLIHNAHPTGDDATFNYWWLAHAVDVRLDAVERTGDPRRLAQAQELARNIRERNDGSLFNDYFDDMLWYGLALLRLATLLAEHDPAAAATAQDDAATIWQHVLADGWNEIHGGSVSWRRQQPGYKNTPANGPFVILGARLSRARPGGEHLDRALQAMHWLEDHLVRDDGFVLDGLGREGGDAVDDWRFTYNSGLYVGACVELFRTSGDASWLDRAERTARASIAELAPDGVFAVDVDNTADGVPFDGGDGGLFKGIWFRYAALLLTEREVPEIRDVLERSTDALWRSARVPLSEVAPADGAPDPVPVSVLAEQAVLRAGDDWRRPARAVVEYSTQLSAAMALEMRAAQAR